MTGPCGCSWGLSPALRRSGTRAGSPAGRSLRPHLRNGAGGAVCVDTCLG